MSIYAKVEKGPAIEVFALTQAFKDDSNQNKVNLSVGAYRTDSGAPWVLPVVRKTEIKIASDESVNHEYLPVTGLESFTSAATELVLGADSIAIKENRAFGVQTISGTGALRVAAEFLHTQLNRNVVFYSNPTWENHHKIFADTGFTSLHSYRYWDQSKRQLDFKGMLADLDQAPPGAVIILHACAHNPTGIDPTQEQWKEIADLMEHKKLFPLFDSAYQGFASGDPDRDAWAVRYFVSRGFELLTCQSFAKNFGLYCERAGNLTVVQQHASTKPAVHSQLTLIIRGMYSNPPAYGARIVSTVLNTPELRQEWMDCIKLMSSRIRQMRALLRDKLVALGTPGNWDHIVNQIGMFSYTGLNENQVRYLIKEYHIYLLKTGRINMCGLNTGNIEYVAKAINASVTAGSNVSCPCDNKL
ncbi:aspartate aminotransferase, cytoplasmic [Drosophila guanche]|uniref:Aspartate aminotransferase, cytoplasmic n=1 Tax=Drosophila guanche TaxID=7266 RepID=A0A3B0J1W3_DROGU|nr:aspartate aminotransferase, cytoplasmic [Drosophila guanche]SPP74995.1 blast:Probable aspartate aminotransferase%2C cytoplasmic [Drosophila guanche]